MIRQYWLSMIFLAIVAQLFASCSSFDRPKVTEEDKETAKQRVPFQYHKHFNEKN